MIVLAFPDYLTQSRAIAERLNAPLAEVKVHRFPDDESFVELPESLPEHTVVCRSLNQPNDKLIELMLCAATARTLGARRLTLIAPYLCYMRQDFANRPGVAISQRIVGKLLANLFDDVITVDPHLHRVLSLAEAVPCPNPLALTAATEIADFLSRKYDNALLLGPDSESEQWVGSIARLTGFDYAVATKTRFGDKAVKLTLPKRDFRDKTLVIVDDMASTGRTMAEAARLLFACGAIEVDAVVTHALFCGDAEKNITESGIRNVWSTDSIDHPRALIKLGKLLAEAVAGLG